MSYWVDPGSFSFFSCVDVSCGETDGVDSSFGFTPSFKTGFVVGFGIGMGL